MARKQMVALPINLMLANRPLAEVSDLTVEDWHAVYIAHQGYLAQLQLIVAMAKARGSNEPQHR